MDLHVSYFSFVLCIQRSWLLKFHVDAGLEHVLYSLDPQNDLRRNSFRYTSPT